MQYLRIKLIVRYVLQRK